MLSTRIFVISLRDSTQRRAMFASRAEAAGVAWEFFDACTEVISELTYEETEALARFGRRLTRGEIGVYSSHYSLWTSLLKDSAQQYIIFEDDVIVDWKRIKQLTEIDFRNTGIDYLKLYFKRPVPYLVRRSRFLGSNAHLIELRGLAYGAQGYVITRAAAARLVPYCRRIVRPIDDQLDRYWDHGIPTLSLYPFPVIEAYGDSTIGDDRFVPAQRTLRRKFHNLTDILKRWLWAFRPSRRTVLKIRYFADSR